VLRSNVRRMNATSIDIDWNTALLDQLGWHWEHQLRPRLEGLRDEEYFWEPSEGCWNVRPRGAARRRSRPGPGTSPSTSLFRSPIHCR
jgi:hypothetical protein